ncbi:MAG: hypothetical protein ACLFR0_01840 [Alphaproteobacteria bacterium]
MKKLIATVCILGSAAMVSACSSTDEGYRDLQPPYEQGRTVGDAPAPKPAPVRASERTFRKVQMK